MPSEWEKKQRDREELKRLVVSGQLRAVFVDPTDYVSVKNRLIESLIELAEQVLGGTHDTA